MSDVDRTVRTMTADDVEQCRSILQAAFPDQWVRSQDALDELELDPLYSPEHRMVVEVNGRVVSHAAIRRSDLWVAGYSLPVVRLGLLATRPSDRGAHHASALVEQVCADAMNDGADAAIAYGAGESEALFRRCGFKRAIYSKPAWQLEVDKASGVALNRAIDVARRYPFRPARPEDAGALNELYYQHFSQQAGCLSRTEDYWRRRIEHASSFWMSPVPDIMVAETDGTYHAYLVVQRDLSRWDVLEFACVTGYENLVTACVARLAQDSHTRGVKWLGVDVSYADPVARDLVPLGLRGHVKYEVVLIRVLNQERIGQALFEVADLHAVSEGTSCAIDVKDEKTYTIGTEDPAFTLHIGPSDAAALLYNGASFDVLLKSGRLTVTPASPGAVVAARRLFPETHAFNSRFDQF